MRDRLAAGAPIARLALGIAGWLHFLRGVDEQGRGYAIDDPQAAELRALHPLGEGLADDRARAARLLAYTPVFGDVTQRAEFIDAVAPALSALRRLGVLQTLQRL